MFDNSIHTIAKTFYIAYLIVGASAGLYSFIDIYRKRVRIIVRKVKEISALYDSFENRNPSIIFEITNLGKPVTGISPQISLMGYEPRGKKIKALFEIYAIDKSLESYKTKEFHAISPKDIKNFEQLWFKTYTFKVEGGRKKKIHFRSADMKILNYAQFVYGLIKLKLFKQ